MCSSKARWGEGGRRGGGGVGDIVQVDHDTLRIRSREAPGVLSLLSFSLLIDIHLSMSDRHSSILVTLLVNSISFFVENEIYN